MRKRSLLTVALVALGHAGRLATAQTPKKLTKEQRHLIEQLAKALPKEQFEPRPRADDYGAAGGDIYQALLATFRTRGMSVPRLQREVHLIGRE